MPDQRTTMPATDGVAVLLEVVDLLTDAARTLWGRAAGEGPLGVTYTVAQDFDLAADLAASLVPEDADESQPPAGQAPEDPLAALERAQTLLGSVPIESLPVGTSQLLVRLADLGRAAR